MVFTQINLCKCLYIVQISFIYLYALLMQGEPSTYYTITVTPLYKEGPGNEITLHNCSQGRSEYK